jgi:hypothetical protein
MAAKPAAPEYPQLPLVFAGGKASGTVHFNRSMVTSQPEADGAERRKQAAFALR